MCTAADLFPCPRHPGDLRLTPAACAALWRRWQGADALDAAACCHGCPIGAAHAGAPVAAPEPPRPPVVCLGCGSECGGRTGRRLVVSRGICVSCYNRERELAIGRDRRGRRPLRAPLPVLMVAVNGDLVTRAAEGRVSLALWALRLTPGAVIARAIPSGTPWQADWLPGLGLPGPAARRRAVSCMATMTQGSLYLPHNLSATHGG